MIAAVTSTTMMMSVISTLPYQQFATDAAYDCESTDGDCDDDIGDDRNMRCVKKQNKTKQTKNKEKHPENETEACYWQDGFFFFLEGGGGGMSRHADSQADRAGDSVSVVVWIFNRLITIFSFSVRFKCRRNNKCNVSSESNSGNNSRCSNSQFLSKECFCFCFSKSC